VRGFDDVLYKL